ncbi:response regulator [Caloramator sp. Dgby_cultured_2]|uniref:response regulator n=1 Tax=Caloramator sp. Dgby_cultured_2 TaxID=3029174 RepID=UPI00237ECBE3|nr:response regulator [Caloramator sp. Dgby_cultured_2]WDU84586.1 response regulator [Caloramator sp. Dgby_cultured_2]
MDGTIEVESRENYGSEFTIKLPIREIKVKEKENTLSCSESNSLKILIIDDQVHVANAVNEMLSLLGHDCSVVTDNGEIEHVLKSKSFDAVICDLAMPGITGVEIAKRIKEQYPKTFFILMTGWLGKLKEEDLIYVDEIMQKPFSIEELRKAIEKFRLSDRTAYI